MTGADLYAVNRRYLRRILASAGLICRTFALPLPIARLMT